MDITPLILPVMSVGDTAITVHVWARFFLIMAGLCFLGVCLVFAGMEVWAMVRAARGRTTAAVAVVPETLTSGTTWQKDLGSVGGWLAPTKVEAEPVVADAPAITHRPETPAEAASADTRPDGQSPEQPAGVPAHRRTWSQSYVSDAAPISLIEVPADDSLTRILPAGHPAQATSSPGSNEVGAA